MTNRIFGGGVTGLVAGYYTGWPVITDKMGGQAFSPFPMGPKYVYANSFTKALLDELGLDTAAKVVKVRYFHENSFVKPTAKLQELYAKKVRGVMVEGTMSGRATEFAVFDVAYQDVVSRLLDECDVVQDTIISIDLLQKVLYGINGYYEYEQLVNTIPLPEFLALCGYSGLESFKSASILFAKATCKFRTIWESEWDYVCFPGSEPFYRLTKLEDPECVYEFAVRPGSRTLVSYFPSTQVEKTYIQKYGKIMNEELIQPHKDHVEKYDVKLLGRWGGWKPRMMLHNVIQEVGSW